MPIVRGMQTSAMERTPEGKRKRVYRRWVVLRYLTQDGVYGFRAEADALTLGAGATIRARWEILSAAFDPLCAESTLCRGGVDHATPAPEALRALALDACRAIALRLHAFGVKRDVITGPWPKKRPSFASIVEGEPAWDRAAEPLPYPKHRGGPPAIP
jgi:hypothetical protein